MASGAQSSGGYAPGVPAGPLPSELGAFLAGPRPCVMATVRADGAPVTVACWYELDGGRVVLTMEEGARRIAHLRTNPAVSLTVLADDWYNYATLLGRVVEFTPDPDLSVIDRLSVRYSGGPYPERDIALVTAVVEVDRWFSFGSPEDPTNDVSVLEVERGWLDRWTNGDTAAYLERCADDVRYFDSFLGRWIDGASALRPHLEQLRGRTVVDSYEIEDPRLTSLGDTANLTYIWVGKRGDRCFRFAVSDLYRRTRDGWRIVQGLWASIPAEDSAVAP